MNSMFSVFDMTQKDLSFIKGSDLRLVTTKEEVITLLSFIESKTILAFDIETTGLSHLYDKIVGFSIADDKTGFYVPINHSFGGNIEDSSLIITILEALQRTDLIYHNSKFDWKFIYHKYGINLPISQDTFIMLALIDSDRIEAKDKLALKPVIKEFFKIDMLELSEDFNTTDFSVIQVSDAVYYAAADAMLTYKLWQKLNPDIVKLELQKIYALELDIIPYVARIELCGVRLDVDFIKENTQVLSDMLLLMKKELMAYGEDKFDVDSPAQLSKLIYDFLKVPKWKESTSVDVRNLEILEDKHEIIPKLIEYSELKKLYSAFFAKISDTIAEDGRIHSDFNQVGTRSGRFSSSGGVGRNGEKIKINMQQMPKSNRFNIRKAFIPDDGYYWMHADYSQLEYRVMASISKEESLIQAYKEGVDFHKKTASIFLNIPLGEVTSEQRTKGKTFNFAVAYGMSKYGLAQKLGIPTSQAERLLSDYFAKLGKLKLLIRQVKEGALKNHYVRTYFGRLRWYRNLPSDPDELQNALRSCFNSVIQGTAADLAKAGMKRAFRSLDEFNSSNKELRLIKCNLTIHDELNFEVHNSIPPVAAAKIIKSAMEIVFPKSSIEWTPFQVDVSIGFNFGELYDIDYEYFDSLEGKLFFDVISELKSKKKEKPVKSAFIPKQEEIIKAIKPSIILEGDFSNGNVDKLFSLFEKNFGLYRVYFKVSEKEHFLLGDSFKLNPSPVVLSQLESLGYKTELIQEVQKIDIDKLL